MWSVGSPVRGLRTWAGFQVDFEKSTEEIKILKLTLENLEKQFQRQEDEGVKVDQRNEELINNLREEIKISLKSLKPK